uniref:Uncharacterized protein n=1 Tax=viral metagenome TaxID=1070528 RepID=A0A6C0HP38_9ZZZZ
MLIRDSDLLKIENKNKYSIRDLRANVDHLNKKFLLHTQRLDEEFCIEYILDIRMDSGDEDSYLFCENYILECQSHLDETLFFKFRDIKYPNAYD